MTSTAQIRASNKYNKEHTMILSMRLNLKNDADIIKYLKQIDNKTGLVKSLIREQIKKDQSK